MIILDIFYYKLKCSTHAYHFTQLKRTICSITCSIRCKLRQLTILLSIRFRFDAQLKFKLDRNSIPFAIIEQSLRILIYCEALGKSQYFDRFIFFWVKLDL